MRRDILNVLHDAIELELGNLRSLEGGKIERISDLVLGDPLLEPLKELVVDTLLNVDAGASAANLSVVVEDTNVGPLDGVLDIGVVEDDVRGLAAELEGDLLQVGIGGGAENGTADEGGTSEGNLVDTHVGGHGGTGDAAETGDQVNDTLGETGLVNEGSGDETGERSLLGSLEDDRVTGSDGGTDLPGPHEHGEVPTSRMSGFAMHRRIYE